MIWLSLAEFRWVLAEFLLDFGMIWLDLPEFGGVCLGFGMIWHDLAEYGCVWLSLAEIGLVFAGFWHNLA